MLCPCESGADAASCCKRSSAKWYKSPENFLPKPPITGFSNPGCYLNHFGDCAHSLSNEHYISAAALKVMGTVLRVTGFPWITDGESKNISVNRLSSGVLCTRHNNAFSHLDTQGGRFVRWVREFCDSSASPALDMVLFNGLDIERWCLKTFLGLVSSASLQIVPGQIIRNINNISRCVDLLIGHVTDEKGRGLWIRTDADRIVKADLSLSVSPISKLGTNQLYGLTFNILGFDFLYSTAPINVENSVFRPSQIKFRSPTRLYTIKISWPPGVIHSGLSVECQWRGRHNLSNKPI